MLDDLKKFAEALGVIGGLLNATILGIATWLLGTVTSSPTYKGYIRIFAVLGGLGGAWFTFAGSAGKGRAVCLRRTVIFGLGVGLSLGFGLFFISLTEGSLLTYMPGLESFRNFFLDNYLLSNFAIGLAAGATMYFSIGAIVLCFPKIWDLKL